MKILRQLIVLLSLMSISVFAQVGIGTTTPVSLTEISHSDGAILYDDTDGTYHWNPYPGELTISNRAENTANSTAAIYFHAGSDIGGTTGVSSARIAAHRTGPSTANLVLGARGGGALEKMRIVGSSGHVGIGVTDPHGYLHIADGNYGRKIVLHEDADNPHQFYGFGVTGGNVLKYQVGSSSDYHIFYSGIDDSNSKELMRVRGDGKVGIGGNPESLFFMKDQNSLTWDSMTADTNTHWNEQAHEVSIVNTEGATIGSYSGIYFEPGTENGSKISSARVGAIRTANYQAALAFGTRGGSFYEKMRITYDGKVGIGTTTPTDVLTIGKADGSFGGAILLNPMNALAEGGQINFAGSLSPVGESWFIDQYSGAATPMLRFESSGGAGMYLLENGNVGVANTTPITKLDVNGNIGLIGSTTIFDPSLYSNRNGSVFQVTNVGGDGSYLNIVATGSDSGNWDSNILFHTRNNGGVGTTEKMRIEDNGEVGIGITNPKARLDVNGYVKLGSSDTSGDATPAAGMIKYNSVSSEFEGYNGAVWQSFTASGGSSGWGLTGNSGTNSATDFIGTSDNQMLVFRQNNQVSGQISSNRTSFGYRSLDAISDTQGFQNTAFGYDALTNCIDGDYNVAVGHETLRDGTGQRFNIAIGYRSMTKSTTGSFNVAVGPYTLYENLTNQYNVAIGYNVLRYAVSNNNTAVGYTAGSAVTLGEGNTLIGYKAGLNLTTGSNNTIIGNVSTGLVASTSNNIIIADGQGNKRFHTIANGNTGMGTSSPSTKLHLSGYITLGSSDASGDATPVEGMIRFNSSTKKFQGYDGTVWVNLH